MEVAECWGPMSEGVAAQLIEAVRPDRADAFRQDLALARKAMAGLCSKPPGAKFGQNVRATMEGRIALGVSFNKYKEEHTHGNKDGKTRNLIREFAESQLEVAWSNAVKCRILRASALASGRRERWHGALPPGRALACGHGTLVRGPSRKKVVRTQGRPLKATPVRELLFAWFCDLRSSIRGRIPSKVVKLKALELRSQYIGLMLAKGMVADAPAITPAWLLRWRRQYGVSFRKPNRRYKISRTGLLRRLLIFWMNNIRVRHFARRVLGYDVGQHCDNCDQKGWFMNHAGSKEAATLELAGAPVVALLENHAHTRMRLSIMTWTTNSLAAFPNGLPLEVCFKVLSGGSSILEHLQLLPGAFSVRCSDSGSYREEHVFAFLELHLPVVDDARRGPGGWCLLYLDIYSGHLSRRIWDLRWERQYILLYHGGGCTGLTQPSDLWLHYVLEQKLSDLEACAFLLHQLLRPGTVPSLTRQEVLKNIMAAWRHDIPHDRSVKWCLKVGLTIALDGSEDARR